MNAEDPTDPTTLDNTPPIATDDNFETFNDSPITLNLDSNDSDPDGDVIMITEVNGTPIDPTTPPITITDPNDPTVTAGTLTMNPDGTLEFTPEPGYIGEPVFEYTLSLIHI